MANQRNTRIRAPNVELLGSISMIQGMLVLLRETQALEFLSYGMGVMRQPISRRRKKQT
jgi:hypothetical protein